MQENGSIRERELNFKIYGFTDWEIDNTQVKCPIKYNAHKAQNLKKAIRQRNLVS